MGISEPPAHRTLSASPAPAFPRPRCALLCALSIILAGQAQAQGVEERLARIEAELSAERERSGALSRRVEELELTLVSVLASQDEARREAVDAQQLEESIGKAVEKMVAAKSHARPAGRDALSIHGQGRLSFRAFGGAPISTDQSFELEHVVLYLSYQFDDQFRLRLVPGTSHDGEVWVVEGYAAYKPADWIELIAGRFLVPFNGTHAWAFPSDSFIEPYLPENSPEPFLYAPWWDEGLMATGSVPFGAEDEHAFYYSLYCVNGFDSRGLQGYHKLTIGDNNENKMLGGRASATFRLGEATRLTFGLAGLEGKYDSKDDLSFYALEGDVELRSGDFGLYLELFTRPAEILGTVIENPAATIQEVARLRGVKLRPQWAFAEGFTLFAQMDWLSVRQPPRQGGAFSVFALDDQEFTIAMAEVGLKIDLAAHLRLTIEAGIFDRDHDLGKDIPFMSLSLLTYF